jgi:hypothetical protein
MKIRSDRLVILPTKSFSPKIPFNMTCDVFVAVPDMGERLISNRRVGGPRHT